LRVYGFFFQESQTAHEFTGGSFGENITIVWRRTGEGFFVVSDCRGFIASIEDVLAAQKDILKDDLHFFKLSLDLEKIFVLVKVSNFLNVVREDTDSFTLILDEWCEMNENGFRTFYLRKMGLFGIEFAEIIETT
jgi:hypothetical protein